MMKRAQSDSNLEGDSSPNGDASSGGGGSGINTSGNYNNNRGPKRHRSNEETIRLLIPSRNAGGIIGKGGQNIKRLRQEFNANINVEDCQGPERTVNISAPELNNALKVVDDIIRNFGEESEIDLRLLIHQSLAGCVIGKAGSKIKEIRDQVGCRILKVFSNMCPQSSDRVVQCIGKAEECMKAIGDILVLIKEVPIKGSIQNYDPVNYDDYLADKYGGFGGDNAGNGGNRNNGGNNRGGRNNNNNNNNSNQGGGFRDRFDRRDDNRNFNRRNDRDGGRGNGNMRGDRDRNSFINPWASNQPMSSSNFGGQGFNSNGFNSSFGSNQFGNNSLGLGGFGGNQNPNSLVGNSLNNGLGNVNSGFGNNPNTGNNGFDNNMGGGNNSVFGLNSNLGGSNNLGNNGGSNAQNDEGRETTQVTIPKDLAGAIIGKAGTRIRRIRMESNAFITIDEPAQGSTDRIITISGTPRQIQLAQYLLQQSVREHRRN